MSRKYTVLLLLFVLFPLNSALALPKKGNKAPNFLVPTYGGGSASLSRLKGKVVVLMFAAEWCPHCRREIPALSSAWKDMGLETDDVVGIVMMVSSQEDKAVNFFKMVNPPSNWKLVTDAKYVAEKYGVSGVPTTIIIDKNGTVADVQVGEVPPSNILRTVALLAGISPPKVNNTQTKLTSTYTAPSTSVPKASTSKEQSGNMRISLGVIILIAVAIIVLLVFGLWYFKTLKEHEAKKAKRKKHEKGK